MKMRFQLVIAFLAVILIPLTLMHVAFFAFRKSGVDGGNITEEAYGILVLSLLLTALTVVSWVYNTMISPLKELNKATRMIADGNLDFQFSVPEGDGEISVLCRSFEEMRVRLKESMDRELESESENRTLVSNITHDLKTPVTSIKGYSEGLLDGVADTPEKQIKYIRIIYNKANEMDRLINELTFYAGIDNNRIPYNFARINISEYFDDCVDEIQVDLESKHINLEYENELDRDVRMIADPEQFKKVINNIIGNSIKYMDKEDGKVFINLSDRDDQVLIAIGDNGRGIDGKDVPFIFDRFYRADASRNSSRGGSGIGLSIVKKIVEDHGGRVWATSELGKGATIYMEFRKYEEA
ncbi:MAG: HAMP domain-containing protein [Lachnospiraceae bacterium]|nr:HAMP domain-containing protein [Lachnospiraceae bacterium]